jgi:uncharacterized membrane protein
MDLKQLKKKSLSTNKKGQAMGNNLLSAVAVVGVGAILMYLIILVSGNFRNTIDTSNTSDLPTEFINSITEVDGNVTDAFGLASIGLYVLAAAAILGVVFVIVRFVR